MANHSDPESCSPHREVCAEALAGDIDRPAIEPRNQQFGMPTLLSEAEGNTKHGANCKSCIDPARSETLSMSRSFLHRSWEVSCVSGGVSPDVSGKASSRKPDSKTHEKSDTPVLPKKLPNDRGELKEAMEGSGVAKGNTRDSPASWTQSQNNALKGMEGVREAAKRDKRLRFTALLHHITPSLLRESFYALKRNAAVGVDGVTWGEYEKRLEGNLLALHGKIHAGTYRTQPSRRVYIPKPDGKQRPLGIAALEDKMVQQAVQTVLSAIYEHDFLGFSYGFRRGRGQHDALDALSEGIKSRKVNWIVDADIRSFFDEIDHTWMMAFLEHRIGDKRVLRLIHKWLKAGVIEEGQRIRADKGTPQGAVISPLLANIYLHYVFDLWAHSWRQKYAKGDVIIIRYADDGVTGFQYEEEARCFLARMQERFAKFGLELHPDKTRLIRFGRFAVQQRRRKGEGKPETFDFLGFTHCCGQNRLGRFELVRLTVKKRMRASLQAIREALMKRRHEPIRKVGEWLKRVLTGYLNYYAVPGNMHRLSGFLSDICRGWRHALMRRSQRHRMSWSRFSRIAKKYIPPCRIVHPFPAERFRVKT